VKKWLQGGKKWSHANQKWLLSCPKSVTFCFVGRQGVCRFGFFAYLCAINQNGMQYGNKHDSRYGHFQQARLTKRSFDYDT